MTDQDEYLRQIERCAKCGACVPVCPLFRLTGRESMAARGKLHLLRKIEPTGTGREFAAIFSRCLQCGACRAECPRDIDIPLLVSMTREGLANSLPPPSLSETVLLRGMKSPLLASLLGSSRRSVSNVLSAMLPEDSGLRIRFSLPGARCTAGSLQSGLSEATQRAGHSSGLDTRQVVLFSGCFARHLQTNIKKATELLLRKHLRLGVTFPEQQTCCGLAFHSSGKRQEARELAMRNIAIFENSEGPIVTPCASCFSHLRSYESFFADDGQWRHRARQFTSRLVELATFLEKAGIGEKMAACRSTEAVYYHDSCHLRLHQKITAPPRRLLRAVDGLTITEADGQKCCGAGGLFALHHPDLSSVLCRNLLQTIDRTEARRVLTSCSGCLLQIHRGAFERGRKLSVQHLTEFLVELLLPGECH